MADYVLQTDPREISENYFFNLPAILLANFEDPKLCILIKNVANLAMNSMRFEFRHRMSRFHDILAVRDMLFNFPKPRFLPLYVDNNNICLKEVLGY